MIVAILLFVVRQQNPSASCYPFDSIPKAYLDWYRAVFEQGVRTPPPTGQPLLIFTQPRKIGRLDSDKLDISVLRTFPADIIAIAPELGLDIAVTTEGVYRRGQLVLAGADVKLVTTPRLKHQIVVGLKAGALRCWDLTDGKEIAAPPVAEDAFMTYQQRVYLKVGGSIQELAWLELASGVQATLKPVANVLAQSAQVFEGVVAQNLLGACHVSVFPQAGRCYSVSLPELKDYAIVEAKFDQGVLLLLASRQGRYDKFILRFDPAYSAYDIRCVPDVAYAAPNLVTLDHGVCLHLNEAEELEIFPSVRGASSCRLLNEPALKGAMLFKNGTQALFVRDRTVYAASLRSPL